MSSLDVEKVTTCALQLAIAMIILSWRIMGVTQKSFRYQQKA